MVLYVINAVIGVLSSEALGGRRLLEIAEGEGCVRAKQVKPGSQPWLDIRVTQSFQYALSPQSPGHTPDHTPDQLS